MQRNTNSSFVREGSVRSSSSDPGGKDARGDLRRRQGRRRARWGEAAAAQLPTGGICQEGERRTCAARPAAIAFAVCWTARPGRRRTATGARRQRRPSGTGVALAVHAPVALRETTSTATPSGVAPARLTPARRRRADNDERASRPAACTSRRPARRAPGAFSASLRLRRPSYHLRSAGTGDADTYMYRAENLAPDTATPLTRTCPRARSRTDRIEACVFVTLGRCGWVQIPVAVEEPG
jgi:hypothetical protein